MSGNALAVIERKALQVQDYRQAGEVVAMLESQLPALRPRLSREFDFLGYERDPKVPAETARSALAALQPLLEPAPTPNVVVELMRLRLVTKTRAEQQAITDAALSIMAEELSVYPADVVQAACRSWGRNSTWWPSLAELNLECEWRARKRLAMARALREALDAAPSGSRSFAATPRRMDAA